ncbi:replicative DNA helicase [Arcanobacterium bovis]|uniref:Replicative DNA helicase n=1 Tax=Arcanobacterium bovis TaxID=2529275 RepID=A0A4Q9UZ45_9ACTO|nr:replicative DNA helicase [Arcanobacterium bovis]TBW21012.1 replicative DNA helicase [Arcanobacterium bovis]
MSNVSTHGFDRVPPQNIAAEESVLGGMLLSKDAIADVLEILKVQDFYKPQHARIYEVILDLFARGEPADAITVGNELQRSGDLDRIGGFAFLHTLVLSVPTAANAAYYANIVKDQAKLRALVEAGTRIVQLGYNTDGGDVQGLLDMAQAEMFAITESHVKNDYADLHEIVPSVLEEIEKNAARDGKLAGLETGFTDLDNVLSGLRPGQMIIVAARPGMGKSTLAMDFCRNAAIKNGRPVAFFSLEMNRTELVMRALAAESDIFLNNLIKGDLKQDQWQRILETCERLDKAPLIVDDSPNLTMTEIRAKARRLRQQHQIELIVIDYLQLLTSGGRTPESRQQEVSEFSRSIKLLAKELDIPIIAVAQLNRNPEQRADKKPQVADLRESGSLEQDADVILLIHRKDDDGSPDMPPSEIIIGKHRAGPTGSVELMFQGNRARFSNFGGSGDY